MLPRIKAKVTARRAALLRDLEAGWSCAPTCAKPLDSALVDEPPLTAKEGGVIRRGYDAELDELHADRPQRQGMDRPLPGRGDHPHRHPSLKVGFNQVFGYYIEITHTHASKIPADYQRKQTLKNAERYITPELKEYEEKVLTAEEKIQPARIRNCSWPCASKVAAQTARLLQTARGAGRARRAGGPGGAGRRSADYCRPELSDEPVLHIARRPASGARPDAAAGHVRAQRH